MELPPSLDATLVLVRHGESTWVAEGRFQGRGNPPLSTLGRRQAQLVARRLAERHRDNPLPVPSGPPVGIWHSPLARAAQTAELIGQHQAGVPMHSAPGLTEIAQGEWQGLTRDEIVARWANELAAWRRAPVDNHAPGGEALPDAGNRVAQALGELLGTLAGAGAPGTVPAGPGRDDHVSGYPPPASEHGLRPEPWAILVAHDGIFRLALMSLLRLPLERFWSFPFNLCAISVIALRGGVASLRAHNLAEHLAPLAAEPRAPAEARGDRGGAL